MEAHTPKREAIEKFVHHESGIAKDWLVRVIDEPHDPIVRLQAWKDNKAAANAPDKSLEVHTRQIRLADEELDESTKTLIRRWLASL